MHARRWLLLAIVLTVAVACTSEAVNDVPDTDPDDPSILRRPFTAEQIREAWIPGLTIRLLRTTPTGETVEQWKVVTADEEGAEIAYSAIDGEGNPIGEVRSERARWIELRDHATYAADLARREEHTRETPLGTLNGWLYSVRDQVEGTLTEYFFASSLPGPPVHMRMTRGEELVMELAVLARDRPD